MVTFLTVNAIKPILTLADLPFIAVASIAATTRALCFRKRRHKCWEHFLSFFNLHQTLPNLLPSYSTSRTSKRAVNSVTVLPSKELTPAYKKSKTALRWNHNVNNFVKCNVAPNTVAGVFQCNSQLSLKTMLFSVLDILSSFTHPHVFGYHLTFFSLWKTKWEV